MRLKSFYGPTMTEAMRIVREALGDNAIIVATRDDEMGGVRVTAAIDDPIEAPARPAMQAVSTAQEEDEGSAAIETIAAALVQHQVPAALGERLLATATQYAGEDPLLSLGAALDTHFRFLPVESDSAGKPLMFVGPPGAGKTLCAAKFATQATLAQKAVALLSTDTERAGGMAQLSAFARLLKSDLMEIEDAHALQDAVSMQAKGSLILIDTAGCNPFDPAQREELFALIKSSGAEPVLVLPADLDASAALDFAKEFEALGAKRLISTRLDMVRRVGNLLYVAHESGLALSHYSASSKVTETPAPMNPVSLARLILPKTVEQPARKEAAAC